MSDRYTTEDHILSTLESIKDAVTKSDEHQHSYIVTEWRYDYNADFSTSEYQKLMHERIPFNRLKAEAYRCSVCLEPWEGDKTV